MLNEMNKDEPGRYSIPTPEQLAATEQPAINLDKLNKQTEESKSSALSKNGDICNTSIQNREWPITPTIFHVKDQ